MSAYLCLYLQFFPCECVCVYECGLAAEQTCFGTGTPNSVAAKIRSAAVPVNDV